jgi:prepilin-type N-terminal cleavage/methylation domain-containing protein
MKRNKQSGFTLIELLTVVSTLLVLAALSLQTFGEYKAKAGYSVALRTFRDARGALEAAFTQPDAIFNDVSVSQRAPGPLTDGDARQLLSAFRLPSNVRFSVDYTQSCIDSSCVQAHFETKHCLGKEYVSWTRFGDGLELTQDRVAGAGCAP